VALGVGSLNSNLEDVADFSGRGMTTTNLLDGIGLLKPDLVSAGSAIKGLSIATEKCEMKSGTSVSSAVMTGAVALVLSSIDNKNHRKEIQNSALIRQALIKSSKRIKTRSVTE
jgi:membrane-bound transcription factor site-1 protease